VRCDEPARWRCQPAARALGQLPHRVRAGADLGPLTRRPVAEANLALHRAVVEGTGNRHLARAHQALRVKIQLLLA
jgi:DNA-binding FadR family transcriptional regulator